MPVDISVASAVCAVRDSGVTAACVVGKGPTADQFVRRPENVVTFGINQASLRYPVDFAVITDLDVAADGFLKNLSATWLILPVYPHVRFKPDPRTSVTTLVDTRPEFRKLAIEGRLLSYRSDRWPDHWPGPVGKDWPRLRVRAFTSVACLAILYAAGLRTVYTAGLDGGRDYHQTFLTEGLTPLSNGQPSFDAQFKEFDRFRKRGMTITAL